MIVEKGRAESSGAQAGADAGTAETAHSAWQAPELVVADFVKLSTVDWPDKLVTTVFLQGCPWNCLYCHNPDLIDPRQPGAVPWRSVMEHLRRRQGLLDGVVFTGGEATRQADALVEAIAQVRELGFGVGLHTAGPYPRRLARLLPLVDWVGFDVKAVPAGYEAVVRVPHAAGRLSESLKLLLESGVSYQVRTTWGPGVPGVGNRAQADAVLDWARSQGVARPVLQEVRTEGARPEFIDARGES